ncbi:Ubiquitin thioesterase OTUB1 [Nymphon striatum]|nr:Ubiquitin thioesterase OTUB1 [Nymphon striatum]
MSSLDFTSSARLTLQDLITDSLAYVEDLNARPNRSVQLIQCTTTTTHKRQASINNDEAILAQEKQIEKEIAGNIPLVGPKLKLSQLSSEYAEDDSVYHLKAVDLAHKYKYMRKTRPDGNCFYRGFIYSYFERLLSDKEEFERIKTVLSGSKDELTSNGFPKFAVDDFYEPFDEMLIKIGSGVSENELLTAFNEQATSDYIVIYLRLITSCHLKKNSDFFSNFMEIDLVDFCRQEVEPMYKESDHVHIIALTEALNVCVCIQYMDRGEGGHVNAHTFPEGNQPSIHLLYRPGHYDILYKD